MQSSLLKFFKSQVKDSPITQTEQQVKTVMFDELITHSPKNQREYLYTPNPKNQRKSRLKQVIDSDEEEGKENIDQNRQDEINLDELDLEIDFSLEKKQSSLKTNSSAQQKKRDKKSSNVDKKQIDKTNIIQEKKDDEELISEFDDSTPEWAKVGRSKDKQLRLHGTEEADPSTLFIPPAELKKVTKTMLQFWTIKSDNFDKIVFFKLGKFYELFYDDAMIGHRHLDLNWMGRKMHTGFPEKALQKYSNLLIEKGFKIAIVDQTENNDQMIRRVSENKKSGGGITEKVVQRELTQVMTKGSVQEDETQERKSGFDERILMCIKKNIISKNEEEYGVAILESQTNVISLAIIRNKDLSYQQLNTLFLQCKPLEVVIDPSNIPQYDPIVKILKGQVINTQLSYLRKKGDNWDGRKTIQYFGDKVPQSVQYFLDKSLVLDALTGLLSYLETILIMQKVLESARFQIYDPDASKQNYMMLDNQALFHLEILQSSLQGYKSNEYSLFGCIDRTVTAGGRRRLRKWVCAPLYNKRRIMDRQDAVEDLLKFSKERDVFRQSLKALPDLERMCAKTYAYSVATTSKAIFYENFSQIRLKEFKDLCNRLRTIDSEIDKLSNLKDQFQSRRLIQLLSRVDEVNDEANGHIYSLNQQDEEAAQLPRILCHLDDFENYIQWNGDTPYPIKGIVQEYDEAQVNVDEYKLKFNDYLVSIRKRMKEQNINYAHAKYRYELELPIKLVEENKPDDFEFTSAKQGFQRFHTQDLKDMVYELERAEENQKLHLNSFVQYVFKHFHQNYRIWDKYVSILAEIDALISLSIWGQVADGIMCRPIIREDGVYFEVQEGRHPCLSMTGLNFVPNDIKMGGDDQDPSFLLLTGPNMGGKSTTLRMVCVLAILAQIGAQVPCKYMELSLIDRIFTRLGAHDQLMEGKSTFFIELEETLVPLNYGTEHSLFITDELGRGTSTFDGVAIAYSVMKYLVEKVKCRVLFATHFRVLVQEANLMKGIKNVHMACYVEEKYEKVVFLYKLKPGACSASFGINVAKVTGIPESILNKAKEKAQIFEQRVGLTQAETINQFNQLMKKLCVSQMI